MYRQELFHLLLQVSEGSFKDLARSLQVQERMTTQIANWLQVHLEPKGVGVVLEAEHLCLSLRGVQKLGARTVTSSLHLLVLHARHAGTMLSRV